MLPEENKDRRIMDKIMLVVRICLALGVGITAVIVIYKLFTIISVALSALSQIP